MTISLNEVPFVNDKKAIGKWERFTIIKHRNEFDPTKVYPDVPDKGFKEIYFLPNSQKYWVFEGWTKGQLFVHYGGDEPVLCYNYEIVEALGDPYMLLEIVEENDAYVEVLIKTSDKQFALNEIGRRENTDIPFVIDEKVLGVWEAVDYLDELSSFKGKDKPDEALWLKKLVFHPTGEAVRVYDGEEWHDKWTKGVLLDLKKSTASKYFFKRIDDIEFLFLEWKMGNYVYGGMPPSYYVFQKVE